MTQQDPAKNKANPEDNQHTPESLKHRKLLIALTIIMVLPPLVLMTLRLMGII